MTPATATDLLPSLPGWLVTASWQAGVLVVLVLLVQRVLGRQISAAWRYSLWFLVLARLVLPVLPPSPLSAYNLLPATPGSHARPIAASPQAPAPAPGAPTQPPASPAPAPHPAPTAGHDLPPRGSDAPPATAIATPPPHQDTPEEPHPQAQTAHAGGDAPPAPPATPPANGDASRPLAWAATVYALAAVVLLVRLAAVGAYLACKTRRLPDARREGLDDLLADCRRTMRVRGRLRVKVAGLGGGPALTGVLRPVLLLPVDTLEHASDGQLRLIILHELAHLRRHDVAVHWLTQVLLAIHWPNMLLHLAFARMRLDRELAADEMVLHLLGAAGSREYGQTILSLARRFLPHHSLPGIVGVLESSESIKRRITMIASYRRRSPLRSLLPAGLLVVLALGALTAASPPATRANPEATPQAATSPAADPAAGGTQQAAPVDPRQMQIPHLRVADTPLQDLIVWIRTFARVDVHVDWRWMEQVGLARDLPVTLDLRDVSLEHLLDLVLLSVPGERLGWTLEDEVLHIGPADRSARRQTTRVYDVRDLWPQPPAAEPPAPAAPGPVQGREDPYYEEGFHPGGTFGGWSSRRDVQRVAHPYAVTELIHAIRALTPSNSWDAEGGYGVIDLLRGQLIVTQSAPVHDQIVEILDRLRLQLGRDLPEQAAQAIRQQEAADRQARERLATVIEGVHFDGAPLRDVLEYLRQATGINWMVDWGNLDQAGVNPETPVTLRLSRTTIERALKLVLSDADPQRSLDYAIYNGTIVVSTHDRLSGMTVLRVYDVRPLLYSATIAGQGHNVIEMLRAHLGAGARQQALRDPAVVQGHLLVRQDPRQHEALARLLDTLRRVAETQPLPAAQPDTLPEY